MIEADTLEDCLIELQPFGNFPTWSLKDSMKGDLPEYERGQERMPSFPA